MNFQQLADNACSSDVSLVFCGLVNFAGYNMVSVQIMLLVCCSLEEL